MFDRQSETPEYMGIPINIPRFLQAERLKYFRGGSLHNRNMPN